MYLVIDIGATKTLIALFSRRGRVMRRAKFPTPQGREMFLRTLVSNLQPFVGKEIRVLVVAVPGTVQKDGTVRFGNRAWGNFDLTSCIKNLFKCPIYLENDGNLAALFEGYGLPGRTVFLTFSTGIGGGVVENNGLVEKVFEPGHKIYTYRGERAEWEDLAAASAIERIYHLDRATEVRGGRVLRDVAGRIFLGLPEIAGEMRPDTIVIGGPLGRIFGSLRRYLPRIPGVKYVGPKRPNESVIYGGYLLAARKDPTVFAEPKTSVGVPASRVVKGRMRKAVRRQVSRLSRGISRRNAGRKSEDTAQAGGKDGGAK